jgi:hypothetical protein
MLRMTSVSAGCQQHTQVITGHEGINVRHLEDVLSPSCIVLVLPSWQMQLLTPGFCGFTEASPWHLQGVTEADIANYNRRNCWSMSRRQSYRVGAARLHLCVQLAIMRLPHAM